MPAPPQQPSPAFDSAKLYVWVKALESKVNNLLREVDLIKNDFMKKQNDTKKELKTLNVDLLEIKHTQEKVDQKMDLIIKELKRTASIEEVQVIKKYLEYWNPLTFVTQRDLERAVEAKLASRSLVPSTKTAPSEAERHKKDSHLTPKKR